MIKNKKATQIFSILWIFESLVILLFFLSPSEVENRTFWLYSTSRLGIIFFAVFLLALSVTMLLTARKEKSPLHEITTKPFWKEALAFGGIFLLLLSRATHSGFELLSQSKNFQHFSGYLPYTQAFSIYFSLLGISVFLWVLYCNQQNFQSYFQKNSKFASAVVGIWILLGILLFAADHVQRNFDAGYNWGLVGPHFPLLEWQIFLAWALSTIFILHPSKLSISDKWIAVIIWAVTLALWLSQPVNPGYGTQTPIAPNYEIYPFSDAQLYDQNSQSVIIGKGMANEEFPARPIYVIFLAITHALVGQDYNAVIAFQSIFLASFPAILYLLGKEISGRPLGVGVALLALLRDIASNKISHFTVSVTYSKILLSELPVAMLLALFLLLAYRWSKKYPKNNFLPIISGGVLGIAIYFRTQSIIALAPTFLLAAFHQKWRIKWLLRQGLLVLLGIALVIAPWLYRNWQRTGGIVLDNPLSQMNVLAVRYSNHPEMTIPQMPGENDSEYSNRMLKIALESMRENPQWILNNIGSHFSQSFLGGFLVFPLRDSMPDTQSILTPTSNFWENWRATSEKSPLLFFYMLLFTIGLVAAWKKERWLGLLPLGTSFFYNLWTALFFAGGVRFSFPVDWVYFFYQMLGLVTLTNFVFTGLGTNIKHRERALGREPAPQRSWGNIAAIIFICAAGLSLPLSEIIVPDQYPHKTQAEMWSTVNAKTDTSLDESLILIEGRALYPRYFPANEGISQTDKPGYDASPESRLVFEVAGQATGRVIFPIQNEPEYIPHTVDITLFTTDGTLETVQYILVYDESRTILYERNHE